ncbi:hypothetical protein ACIPSA_09570 [Streptomyces sp. NPDC086549]|uniref:hypothetical protein n=1 Tax=Streptomyces sp. NPDC086549 TaxID=3365752 RepID=UPI0037FDAB6F
MGEQQSDGGLFGRRRAHPDHAVSGPRGAIGAEGLEAFLGAALRAGAVDPEAEQRAAAAFRAARDAGAHRAETRPQDDWRPRERERARRSVKTMAAMVLASLTLGGVAVAAIGKVSSGGGNGDGHRTDPTAGASHGPAAQPSPTTSGPATPDRPDTAKDTLAHCRAYEQVKDRGKALDSTAWQRLVRAAGGAENVETYCAGQLAQADANKADKTDKASSNANKSDKGNESNKADKGDGSGNASKSSPQAKATKKK